MIYGGELPKPVPPPKTGISYRKSYNGPQAYTCGIVAKQSGSDYKIRLRDIERLRTERWRTKNEDDFKSLNKHAQHHEMIDVADKKHFYKRIKKLVECEMKANEHLFIEECPKPDLKVEEEPEPPKVSEKDLLKKAKELQEQREEIERKIVEEKRLQLFIENSEELRSAAKAKRKKEISEINYKIFQDQERAHKEQTLKQREEGRIENLESIRKQVFEKEEEKRKILEKKQQFRKELYEQVQQKNEIRNQEKELKIIECNDYKILNEQLNEEEILKKLERTKQQVQKKEEIQKFTEERDKLFSNMNKAKEMFDETFAITMRQNLKDDTADEIEAKIQLRRENEMFMKSYEMIKEERKRQNEELSKRVLKQISEIEELKRSIDHETAETRRKRVEEANEALKEQLKLREKFFEQQKDLERKQYEESVKEYEEYLETKKRQWEQKQQFKWQFRKDLSDQIKSRKDIIEKQRKIDYENNQRCTEEFAEEHNTLKKLLKEL